MDVEATANTIIDNALATSIDQVELANAYTDSAQLAAQSFITVSAPNINWDSPPDPATPPEDLTPLITTLVDGTVTIYDQLVKDSFAAFMSQYYPNHGVDDEYLRTKLIEIIEGGGTILPPAIEDAVYNRARGRNDMDALAAEQAAYADFASRGFSMPPGAVLALADAARRISHEKNAGVSSDIAVKQAELLASNVRFALEELNKMRRDAIGDAVKYIGVLIDAIKTRNTDVGAIVQARSVFIDSYYKYYSLLNDKAKLELDAENYDASYESRAADTNVSAFTARVEAQVRAAVAGADSAGRIAAAAIGAQNTMTSIGASTIVPATGV